MTGYDRPRQRIKVYPVPDELEFLYSTRDIKALRDGYEAELDELRALAHVLYEHLDRLIPDDGVLGPSVAAVKARYRQARQ